MASRLRATSRRPAPSLLAAAALACFSLLGCSLNDPPNITGVSPSSGPLAGGTQITISGQGFTSTSLVYIGGVPCQDIQFSSTTSTSGTSTTSSDGSTSTGTSSGSQLVCTSPPGTSLGDADVTVINRDGQRGHLKNGFEYVGVPTITTFSPAQNLAGGQEVINGSGFETGVSVSFGGTLATVNGVTPTAITCVVPTQPDGQSVVSVTITNPDGGTTSGTFTFGIPTSGSSSTTTTTTTTGSATITTIAGSATKGFAGDGAAATAASLSGPSGVVVGSDGSIYIADTGNNRIRQISSAGTISTVAGNGTAGLVDGAAGTSELNGPTQLAISSSNVVYIADTANNAIRTLAGGTLTTIANQSGAVGNGGDSGAATAAALSGPLGVAVDSQGNVLIADTGNNRVRRIDVASKNIANFAGQSLGTSGFAGDGGAAIDGSLSQPGALVLDSLANLYIADRGNVRIRKVDTSGNLSTLGGTGTNGFAGDGGPATDAEFGSIGGLACDASNSIYVADTTNQRVRVIANSSHSISTIAGNGTAGFSGDSGPATSASLNAPYGIFVDTATGVTLVADSGDGSVRQIH